MWKLLCIVLAVFFTCGCASTKVTFSADGKLTSITHKRFIINEEFKVQGGSNWTADCKSKPDEATVMLAKSLIDLAATAGKATAK